VPDLVLTTVAGWWERYQLWRELDALRQRGELERTLADSGIGSSDVYRLLRAHPRTRQQLAAMMRRVGIDRAALPRSVPVLETLRAMEWRCGECADWRKCRAWLASSEAPEGYPAFCPNVEAFERLRGAEAGAGAGRDAL
jgi:hypothetical protein